MGPILKPSDFLLLDWLMAMHKIVSELDVHTRDE